MAELPVTPQVFPQVPGAPHDWLLLRLREDPAFLDGALAIPPAKRRVLRDLDRRGVKFDELFIAHEITKIGSDGNLHPGNPGAAGAPEGGDRNRAGAPGQGWTARRSGIEGAERAGWRVRRRREAARGRRGSGTHRRGLRQHGASPPAGGGVLRGGPLGFGATSGEENMKYASCPDPAASEPVLLAPSRDRATGEVVYALPPDVAKHNREVTRCTPRGPAGPAVIDLVLTRGGETTAADTASDELRPVSRIPQARMAAGSWEEIAQELRNVEEGKRGWADVELRPGGQLVLAGRGKDTQPVSRLPQGRMAAANVGPTEADVTVLRHLDPDNAEQWSPVLTDLIAGWTFRLTPPFAGQGQFVFLAFRSPSDGNAYRIAVLHPDMDAEFGHIPHMIRAHVGGQRIPVICGPDGRPAADLAEVRTHAAKWMAYTSARMAGRNPGFSL